MEFEIKAPSYYSKHYELDKEIIDICNDISLYMQKKSYSNIINRIEVFPVVAPQELLDEGLWKEWVKVSKGINRATSFKHIDYNSYINGTVEERKKLTIQCVIEAIWDIKKKSGTKFNAEQFEKDLLEFMGYRKFTKKEEGVGWMLELSGEEIFPVSWDIIQDGLNSLIQTDDDSYLTLIKKFDKLERQFLQTALPTVSSGLPPIYSVQTAKKENEKIILYEIEMHELKDVIAFFKDYYNGKELDLSLFKLLPTTDGINNDFVDIVLLEEPEEGAKGILKIKKDLELQYSAKELLDMTKKLPVVLKRNISRVKAQQVLSIEGYKDIFELREVHEERNGE